MNFNTQGTAAAYSGPLIFSRLGINAEKTFIPHQVALEQMRKGKRNPRPCVSIIVYAHSSWGASCRSLHSMRASDGNGAQVRYLKTKGTIQPRL